MNELYGHYRDYQKQWKGGAHLTFVEVKIEVITEGFTISILAFYQTKHAPVGHTT